MTVVAVYVEIKQEPKLVRGKRGGSKYEEQEPFILSPFTLALSTTWKDFLVLLTDASHAGSVGKFSRRKTKRRTCTTSLIMKS
jgi:hypothetical protein